jgi:hypothetical protein
MFSTLANLSLVSIKASPSQKRRCVRVNPYVLLLFGQFTIA